MGDFRCREQGSESLEIQPCLQYQNPVSAGGARDTAEVGAADRGIRRAKLRRVRDVLGRGANLEREALVDLDALEQVHVHAPGERRGGGSEAQCAELSW